MSRPSFQVKVQRWVPHLTPVDIAEASPEQRAAMQITPSGGKVSDYVRTLAHDPESYVARTSLFNAIMYAPGGLSQAERELGALGASMTNGCAYCASVHARRFMQLTDGDTTVEVLYRQGFDAAVGPRQRAILDFARALSVTPPAAGPEHIQALRDQNMDDSEILDLIHAVAIFGNANRLMHSLGHSSPADSAGRAQRRNPVRS